MKKWGNIRDDVPKKGVSNTRGRLSFAMAGKDTRSTQVTLAPARAPVCLRVCVCVRACVRV